MSTETEFVVVLTGKEKASEERQFEVRELDLGDRPRSIYYLESYCKCSVMVSGFKTHEEAAVKAAEMENGKE